MALSKEFLLNGDISLKEKYLSFDKEKRIRRMQFFERILIPGILLGLFLYIPTLIFSTLFSPDKIIYITIIFNIIYLIVIFKYYPIIIQKRAHDFGKEGKIETKIILGGTFIVTIYTICLQYFMVTGNLKLLTDLVKYSSIFSSINMILMVLWLYLLFRPGTKGINNYGEQKYYKLKFLG